MPYRGVPDTHGERATRRLIRSWAQQIHDTLIPHGRAWINVPNYFPRPGGTGNDDRWSLASEWTDALQRAGMTVRDHIVWVQEGAADADCAWGSYLSPNNPNLRGCYEVIIVASKGQWARGRPGRNDLPTASWAEWTRNVWTFRSQTQKGWHPCPYPAELPRRAILLSTWPNETVLDPWMGSNVTGRCAEELGRRWISADLSAHYCRLAHIEGVAPTLIPAHEYQVPKPPKPPKAPTVSEPKPDMRESLF